jgi:selenocysteine lyase/cysteine desulfurase
MTRRTPLPVIRALADASGYRQPSGERRSYLLVDGAQLVPGSFVDVQALGVDYLAFSFHKMLAPFGVGVLYAREQLLDSSLPFLSTSRAATRSAWPRLSTGPGWNRGLAATAPHSPTTRLAWTRPQAAA